MFGSARDEITEKFKIFHNEELCDLYRSTNIVGARGAQSV
jgi:hypothetical protein